MRLWVDADACPAAIRDIIVRAAERTQVKTTFVANQYIKTPPSKYVTSVQVPAGFDVADAEIVRLADVDDLVITSDIPLAAEVIEKGATALSHRGEAYTRENIRDRLNVRDFMETLRASGIQSGGQKTMDNADRMAFANKLDSYLARFTPKKRT